MIARQGARSGGETILVVDDEPAVLNTVRAYLEAEGYTVETAGDGSAALELARALNLDLIVLDIMLPGVDGLEVLRRLRQQSPVYVLLLTARSYETDRVTGLTAGADDYLVKPFSPRELVARVRAILRRTRSGEDTEPVLSFQRLRIDAAARQVHKDDRAMELTPIEFDLLLGLAQNRGRVLSREQLIERVWGREYYCDERVVDVHVGRLRKKLEDDPANPGWVVTVRGAGYRFEAEAP